MSALQLYAPEQLDAFVAIHRQPGEPVLLAIYGGPGGQHIYARAGRLPHDLIAAELRRKPKLSLGVIIGVPRSFDPAHGTRAEDYYGSGKSDRQTQCEEMAGLWSAAWTALPEELKPCWPWDWGALPSRDQARLPERLRRAQKRWGAQDSHIAEVRCSYLDFDGGTTEQQRQAAEALSPTHVEHTGGKSLHPYFLLPQGQVLSPEQFRIAQRLLIAQVQATWPEVGCDRAIQAPSHIMRARGARHPKTQQLSTIAWNGGPPLDLQATLAAVEAAERAQPKGQRTSAGNRGAGRLNRSRTPVAMPDGPNTTEADTDPLTPDEQWLAAMPPDRQNAVLADMLRFVPGYAGHGTNTNPDAFRTVCALVHAVGGQQFEAIVTAANWGGPGWSLAEVLHAGRRVGSSSTPARLQAWVINRATSGGWPRPSDMPPPTCTRPPSPPQPPRPEPELITGGPLAIAQRLIAERQQRQAAAVLLNATAPGIGKTRDVNPIADALLASREVALVVYCASDYRSPNDPTLAKWAAMEARHGGIEEVIVNGTTRRRRRAAGSTARTVENPTCLLSNTLARLRAQGISSGHEKAICDRCTYKPTCTYLRRQTAFLTHLRGGHIRKLRCAAQSLVALKTWMGEDWQKVVVIADEMPPILSACSQSYDIPWAELERWRHYVSFEGESRYSERDRLVELLTRLRHMEQRLKDLDREAGQGRHYEMFGLDAIELHRDLQGLREQIHDIPASWLQIPEEPVVDLTHSIVNDPLLLPPLAEAVMGHDGFAARVTPSGIELTIAAAPEFHQALAAAYGLLVLDGTAHPVDVAAAVTPADPEALVTFTTDPRTGLDNILALQITGAGPLSSNRGTNNKQNEHRDRIIDTIARRHRHLGVIDYMKHIRAGWGAWFSSSRGTNAFSNCDALALVGVPNINLGAGLSQFAVLHRLTVAHPDLQERFQSWYARRREEELLQAIHRLRPVRRDRWLFIYLLSSREVALNHLHFTPVKAHALAWAAGDSGWVLLDAARTEIVAQLSATGQEPSQRQVAEALAAATRRSRKPGVRSLTTDAVRNRLQRALATAQAAWGDLLREACAAVPYPTDLPLDW